MWDEWKNEKGKGILGMLDEWKNEEGNIGNAGPMKKPGGRLGMLDEWKNQEEGEDWEC